MFYKAPAIPGETQASMCEAAVMVALREKGEEGGREGVREQPYLPIGPTLSNQLDSQGRGHQDLASHQEAGSRGQWSRARPHPGQWPGPTPCVQDGPS